MSKKLTKKERELVVGYCKLFPQVIHVSVMPCEGSLSIRIKEFPKAITQSDNSLTDLMAMIRDCTATVLRVPKKYLPFMPEYLPSMELAKKILSCPLKKSTQQGKLSVVRPCKASAS